MFYKKITQKGCQPDGSFDVEHLRGHFGWPDFSAPLQTCSPPSQTRLPLLTRVSPEPRDHWRCGRSRCKAGSGIVKPSDSGGWALHCCEDRTCDRRGSGIQSGSSSHSGSETSWSKSHTEMQRMQVCTFKRAIPFYLDNEASFGSPLCLLLSYNVRRLRGGRLSMSRGTVDGVHTVQCLYTNVAWIHVIKFSNCTHTLCSVNPDNH